MCSVPLTVSCRVPANPPLRAHICGIPICPLTTLLAANGAPLLFMSMYMYIVYVYCIVPQGSSNKYSPQCTAHVWCPYLAYLSTLNMGYPWKDLAKCSFIGFRSIGPPCQKHPAWWKRDAPKHQLWWRSRSWGDETPGLEKCVAVPTASLVNRPSPPLKIGILGHP